MPSTVVLITGANRGIGFGFVANYASRPHHTVIACVRNLKGESSRGLSKVITAEGSKVVVVKIDNSVATDPKDAIDILNSKFGITHIDVVLANAGIAKFYGPALNTPLDGFVEHLQVNTVAVLGLFIAAWPLLKRSSKPIFVPVSSTVGSIGDMEQWPMSATAYGASKAALNWVTKNLHIENPSLIAFPIHPGWVQTDMGNAGAVAHGLEEAPTTVVDSINGMVEKIDNATREKTSGTFVSYDGLHINW